MITKQKNKNAYEVYVYDWIDLHDNYICGYVKRCPSADVESDLQYWMFYPHSDKPLSVRNMMEILNFTSELNEVLKC